MLIHIDIAVKKSYLHCLAIRVFYVSNGRQWVYGRPIMSLIYICPSNLLLFCRQQRGLSLNARRSSVRFPSHYSDVIIGAMASQTSSLMIVYSTGYLGADVRKISKIRVNGLVRGIHWWPVNSQHKGPVTRKMFPFDDVIMTNMEAKWMDITPFYANDSVAICHRLSLLPCNNWFCKLIQIYYALHWRLF